jgi:hypothetical protein
MKYKKYAYEISRNNCLHSLIRCFNDYSFHVKSAENRGIFVRY